MSTEIPSNPESRGSGVGVTGEARKTRGIRFSDSEWGAVKTEAGRHGLSAAEFVRMACLDAARDGNGFNAQTATADLAPLVERTFRYAYFLATLKRDELVNDGRGHEVENLIAAARKIQDGLRRDHSN